MSRKAHLSVVLDGSWFRMWPGISLDAHQHGDSGSSSG